MTNSNPDHVYGQYDLARKLFLAAAIVLSALVFGLPLLVGPGVAETLSEYLAIRQDLPLVPLFMACALLRLAPSADGLRSFTIKPWVVLAIAIATILLCGSLGYRLVFQGYDLSRDEQMAVFDQRIFAHGKLVWPIAPEWRPWADALNRRFMLPIGDREYWVSGYLPMNAAFRALVSKIANPNIASPLMAALGAYSAWAISRRLWPQSTFVATTVLILFVGSTQILITSMTAFSMSMHLALNLLWLLLFLQDRRLGHALAILVGFVATGIHQPLFHPLFVAPFLVLLANQRRWRALALYVGAYVAIGLFWIAWPHFITAHGSMPPTPVHCVGAVCTSGVGFLDRLLATLTSITGWNVFLTAANLLRFICWQHPLMVPLAMFGVIACWRAEPLVKALAVGFVLPILFMAIALPWQGHGWGYRYLHPVLGNALLLAGYGVHRLEQARVSIRLPLLLSSIIALALLPVHALMARHMVLPFAQIHRAFAGIPAEVVLVDADTVPLGEDFVNNDFDLRNRPVLMISELVDDRALPALCKTSTIAFFDAPRLGAVSRLFGFDAPVQASAHQRRLQTAATLAGCTVMPIHP